MLANYLPGIPGVWYHLLRVTAPPAVVPAVVVHDFSIQNYCEYSHIYFEVVYYTGSIYINIYIYILYIVYVAPLTTCALVRVITQLYTMVQQSVEVVSYPWGYPVLLLEYRSLKAQAV